VRTTSRVMAAAAVASAVTLALGAPANAASTVRAQWDMSSLPSMVDSAGGDNTGKTKNVTLKGGHYSFNGTSSLATVPDKANLDPGSATIRLTARVNVTAVPRVGQTFDIVRKGVTTSAGGDYKMEIYRESSGEAVAACSFKDAKKVSGQSYGTVDLAGTGWQTITCIKTSSSITVIAGGQTRTSRKALGAISNSAPVYVGGKGDGTDEFNGLMDQVTITIG
jgi:Concanavalin A-like lectin/glucanases superfamily